MSKQEGGDAIVQLLARRKADLNAVNHSDETPLLLAVKSPCWSEVSSDAGQEQRLGLAEQRRGAACVARALLSARAEPDGIPAPASTPLMEAARRGNVLLCSLLMDAKAELQRQDASGRTPTQLAKSEGHASEDLLSALGDFTKHLTEQRAQEEKRRQEASTLSEEEDDDHVLVLKPTCAGGASATAG